MSINTKQFKDYIIVPVLKAMTVLKYKHFNFCTQSRINLLLGTAAVESNMGTYIHQKDGKPAMSPFQIEPDTHESVWKDFLVYRPELSSFVSRYRIPALGENELNGNLYYATIIACIKYYMSPGALPEYNDIKGLGAYWKDFYNTHLGALSRDEAIDRFVDKYDKYVRPYVN